MRRTTKLLLGGAVGAVLTTVGAPSAWANVAVDELVCVDISTKEIGCCLVDDAGKPTKCFKVNV